MVQKTEADTPDKRALKMGKRLFETLLGFGVGVLGAIGGIFVDSRYKNDEFDRTKFMLDDLKDICFNDDNKSNIVANEN